MRITCPLCGERDRREFYYKGDAIALDRPHKDAGLDVWDDYLHLRDNPAGDTTDMWHHSPCGAWIAVERNTVTHAVTNTSLAAKAKR
jgi:sarcosine oxidase subunit delta